MAAKQKILIVDDDNNIAELISLYLTKECFDTKIIAFFLQTFCLLLITEKITFKCKITQQNQCMRIILIKTFAIHIVIFSNTVTNSPELCIKTFAIHIVIFFPKFSRFLIIAETFVFKR